MRHFCSYGPVDCEEHFCVPRTDLVNRCAEQLIGNPEKGGHFFTIWAPRQTGKTWLIHQVKKILEKDHPESFATHCFSLGDLRGMIHEPSDGMEFPDALSDVLEIGLPGNPVVKSWKEFRFLFSKDNGIWNQPLILFIDEVDTAPPALLDLIVGRFREMYIDRPNNRLHGLALVGVRAVLGVESGRGSPFNIQKSMHVPNFSREEVDDLFRQYQEESGQRVEPLVVRKLYDATRGQPGLVGWFGELLTEKYNPGFNAAITTEIWEDVHYLAIHREWNNTILNLIKKAQGKYAEYVMELFTRPDLPFSIRTDWCSYLYLNGIISDTFTTDPSGKKNLVCRFSSPFIHRCLFDTFTMDLYGDRVPILALEPGDDLSGIFDKPGIDTPALLKRYKQYLKRLKVKGTDPWEHQPRRSDLHYTGAAGHFHLYAWLQNAIGRYCSISPEFPAGNGRVDLHLRCGDQQGLIEVKSFRDRVDLEKSKEQAAGYAQKLSLASITLAVFVPVEDEEVLVQLSGGVLVDGVRVSVVAVGWV